MSNLTKNTYPRDENGLLYCNICGYKPPIKTKIQDGKEVVYQNKSTLKYHLDNHKGKLPHICKYCDKGFLHKNVLETHIAAIHPNDEMKAKTFCCNVPGCTFSSWQKGNLIIHKSRKHCLQLVNDYHIQVERQKQVLHTCSCCGESFDSGSHFHHHILKCLQRHNVEIPVSID